MLLSLKHIPAAGRLILPGERSEQHHGRVRFYTEVSSRLQVPVELGEDLTVCLLNVTAHRSLRTNNRHRDAYLVDFTRVELLVILLTDGLCNRS